MASELVGTETLEPFRKGTKNQFVTTVCIMLWIWAAMARVCFSCSPHGVRTTHKCSILCWGQRRSHGHFCIPLRVFAVWGALPGDLSSLYTMPPARAYLLRITGGNSTVARQQDLVFLPSEPDVKSRVGVVSSLKCNKPWRFNLVTHCSCTRLALPV